MSCSLSTYFRKRVPALLTMLVLLCMLSTDTLLLAHDLKHTNHEQTELCDVLNSFATNNDLISSKNSFQFSSINVSNVSICHSNTINQATVLNQRSRSPPHSLFTVNFSSMHSDKKPLMAVHRDNVGNLSLQN